MYNFNSFNKTNKTNKNSNINNTFISKNNQSYLKFNPLKSDFPELHVTDTSKKPKEQQPKEENMKFTEIVKKENKIEEEPISSIPEGWVSYSLGKHNKIEIEYGPNTEPMINIHDEVEEFTPTEIMNNAIDIIIQNREDYKMNFIERNGEDEYNRIYINYQNTDNEEDDQYDADADSYFSENEYDGY